MEDKNGKRISPLRRFQLNLKITWREIVKHKLNFCLGFTACVLVTTVVALIISLLSQAPVIFLRLSEASSGEIDLILVEDDSQPFHCLNYSLLANTLATMPSDQQYTAEQYSYHSPRYQVSGSTYSLTKCLSDNAEAKALYDLTGNLYGFDNYTSDDCPMDLAKNCVWFMCPVSIEGVLYAIDTEKERRMGLGRAYHYPAVPRGEVYVMDELAKTLNLAIGDTLVITLDFVNDDDLAALWKDALASVGTNITEKKIMDLAQVNVPLKVSQIMTSSNGKYNSDANGAMIVEYADLVYLIASNLHPYFPPPVSAAIGAIDADEYAQQVVMNLPPPRINFYVTSDADAMQRRVVQFTAGAIYRLGFTQIGVTIPILRAMQLTRFFSLFLGLIINIIIVVLGGLSIVLIYSLLMINVETRTFETGVMRMVGSTRQGIVELMLTHAFSYAIPAYCLGMIVAQVVYVFIARFFESSTTIPVSRLLSGGGIGAATALGIAIPAIACVFPIRAALGRSLLDSLDHGRSKTPAVAVSISRSEDGKLSPFLIIVGGALAIFGVLIYYFFPLALLSNNLGLLLNIFFGLIIGMLLGLTMLSMNVQHFLERAVLMCFAGWWEKPAVLNVARKNLVAHRMRNRKTTLLYAVSLAVIIFISVSYSIQINSFIYGVQQDMGALVTIEDASVSKHGLNFSHIDAYVATSPLAVDWAYVTYELRVVCNFVDGDNGGQVMNVGRTSTRSVNTYGITSNFFTAALPGFLITGVTNDSYRLLDAGEQVYTIMGSHSGMLSTSIKDDLQLPTLDTHYVLENQKLTAGYPLFYERRLTSTMMVTAAPHFTFSKFPGGGADLVVSLPTWVRMTGGLVTSVEDAPLAKCIIQIKDKASKDDVAQLVRDLRLQDADWKVTDYNQAIGPTASTAGTVSYFFDFTTVIAMLISFFSLVSTMYSNIHQQTKEIGVLRAMGLTKSMMRRVYVHEAITLVFAAALMGIIIGSLVAYTVALQQILFTQLPIPFSFPWLTVIIVFIISILSGTLSAFFPITKLVKMQITQIMRIF